MHHFIIINTIHIIPQILFTYQKIILLFIGSIVSFTASSQEDITHTLRDLYFSKQYNYIIKNYTDHADLYPAKAIYYIGMAYYVKVDHINALKYMQLSLDKDSNLSETHYIKGLSHNYLEEFDKAIICLKKAIHINSHKGDYYSALGDSYLNIGNLNLAMNYYKNATERKLSTDRPYIMIPQIYAEIKEDQKALKAFYTAKEKISPDSIRYTTIVYNIGIFELLNNNYNKAETAFKEVIDLDPYDYAAYAKIIQTLYAKKEYSKVIPYRKKLYEAYYKQQLSGKLKEMFCFDQFEYKNNLIQAFERYEVKKGDLYYKHIFYIINMNNQIEFTVQTETSPIMNDQAASKYIIGMDKKGKHSVIGHLSKNFEYHQLKKIVLDIIQKQ